jgi:hypothetical protein
MTADSDATVELGADSESMEHVEFGPHLSVIRPMLQRQTECHHLYQRRLLVAMTLVRSCRHPIAARAWRVVQGDAVDKI